LKLFVHSLYVDYQSDHKKSVLLCGAPRSGTTWLAEVINHAQDYRLLYEPFNNDMVPLCAGFSERQYLRPDDDNPNYLEPAKVIFTGRARDAWIDQYNRPGFARRRLIKDVRSTLMLKWIRNHFPGMKIIFVVRHPCAVAVSRTKLGWRSIWRETFFDQQDLMTDYITPFRDTIEAAQSPFQRHIVDWCVENFVPFSQLNPDDVYVAFYENLCANPTAELRTLFQFLGLPFGRPVLKRANRPSITARVKGDQSAVLGGENLVETWRKHVTDDELEYAKRTTTLFGLSQIYCDESLADAGKANELLRKSSTRLATSAS